MPAECLNLNFPSKSFLLLLNIVFLQQQEKKCIKEANLGGWGEIEKKKTGLVQCDCKALLRSMGLASLDSIMAFYGTQLSEPSPAFS